jgi:uncharacterized membrane protein YkvA (DUF1232 family)
MMSLLTTLKQRAAALQKDVLALALAYRDPRTPWFARAWSLLVLAYMCSSIDLIPDFIPVLGYLDDLILIPMGIAIAVRLIPPAVLADARAHAQDSIQLSPAARIAGAVLVVLVWLGIIALLLRAFGVW